MEEGALGGKSYDILGNAILEKQSSKLKLINAEMVSHKM